MIVQTLVRLSSTGSVTNRFRKNLNSRWAAAADSECLEGGRSGVAHSLAGHNRIRAT